MMERAIIHECDAMPHGMSVWRYEGSDVWQLSMEPPNGQVVIAGVWFCPYCGQGLAGETGDGQETR